MTGNRAFVFTGISFLLVIPAVLLMASFINMIEIGNLGNQVALSGDRVFYACDNLITYLDRGARDGERKTVLKDALAYAQSRELNFSNTTLGDSFHLIILEDQGRIKCNKTIELRSGTLRVDLNLSNYYDFFNSLPRYLRTGNNSIINTSSKITYPNGSLAQDVNVTAQALGNTSIGWGVDGYHNVSFNITALFDLSSDCSAKQSLGLKPALSLANKTDWWDGEDDEEFYVHGDLNYSVVIPSLRKKRLGFAIRLRDELGHEVTEYVDGGNPEKDCGLNYTAPLPDITIELWEGGSFQAFWETPTNITEGSGKYDGIFVTTSTFTINPNLGYTAIVEASQIGYADFIWIRPVRVLDHVATEMEYRVIGGGDCNHGGTNSKNGTLLNATNEGTQKIGEASFHFWYTNSTGSNITLSNDTYTWGGGLSPGDSRIFCSDPPAVDLPSGTPIYANITRVIDKDIPTLAEYNKTNNFLNGTVT